MTGIVVISIFLVTAMNMTSARPMYQNTTASRHLCHQILWDGTKIRMMLPTGESCWERSEEWRMQRMEDQKIVLRAASFPESERFYDGGVSLDAETNQVIQRNGKEMKTF